MSIIDWLTVLAVVICLVISAFFSASETALTASSRAAMMRLEKQGNRDAGIVNRLLATRERLLGAILFANNFTNIAASTLATGLLLAYFGQAGEIYATLRHDVHDLHLRRSAAEDGGLQRARPHGACGGAAGRADGALVLAVPADGRVAGAGHAARVGMPVGKIQSILSPREELRGAVDLMHRAGVVEKLDRDMMGGVLDLRELTVSDVMVHRTKMVMLDADEPPRGIDRCRAGAPA